MNDIHPSRPVYDHIPTLNELMPQTGGIPGVTYAQIATHNLSKAQDAGYGKVSGKQLVYTIQGPNGVADCELYATGQPIPGQDTTNGRRKCYVDIDIKRATGHGMEPEPAPEPKAPKVAKTAKAKPAKAAA
jgi:hypothetical protein